MLNEKKKNRFSFNLDKATTASCCSLENRWEKEKKKKKKKEKIKKRTQNELERKKNKINKKEKTTTTKKVVRIAWKKQNKIA